MLISELLVEQARAPLYHGTSWQAAQEILHDGGFLGFSGHPINGKMRPGLSATRSPRMSHLDYDPGGHSYDGKQVKAFNVLFVLNQDVLRQHFQVLPVDYFKGNDAFHFSWDKTTRLKDKRAESEEFIVIPKGSKVPLKGIVSKIIFFPYSFADPANEPENDEYLKFTNDALRYSIPVVRNDAEFDYADATRAWRQTDRASTITHGDKNEVSLNYSWDVPTVTDLLRRYDAADGPKNPAAWGLFSKSEQVLLWQLWLRLNSRPMRTINEPMNPATLRVLFSVIRKADTKHAKAYHKIMPFKPAQPPPLPPKHNGGKKTTLRRQFHSQA